MSTFTKGQAYRLIHQTAGWIQCREHDDQLVLWDYRTDEMLGLVG